MSSKKNKHQTASNTTAETKPQPNTIPIASTTTNKIVHDPATVTSDSDATDTTTASISTSSQTHKKRKIKRIRLLLKKPTSNPTPKPKQNKQNDEAVISREASLKPSSPLITNKRRRYPRIEEFEIKLNVSCRSLRRNPYICCYSFFNGYKIGITMTLGARSDVKDAIKILSQELVSTRAKASIQTQKNSFLVYIKTRKDKMIGCSIVHVDSTLKRVNIEMFAVDEQWRGNGFASMMVYLIQYKMINYYGYDLFVCAATSAVPFWSNKKYNFVQAAKSLLEQHEIEDEKHGGTKHLIWYGTPIQARCALLKCFVQSC